jgi:transcription antitermination factor NusG
VHQQHCEQWFALQVWTQHENSVAKILALKGIETLSPNKRVWRRWRDRTQACDIPLFPGYVFAKFDAERKLPVVVTPKVQNIVGFGKNPSPVPVAEIEAIRRVAESGLDVESGPAFSAGDMVQIVSGPLAGVCGVLAEMRSVIRLVVSVEMINRSISVEVTPGMVIPVRPNQPSSVLYSQL